MSAAASVAVEGCSPPGIGMLDFILITDNVKKLPVNLALGCNCPNFSQSFIVMYLPLHSVCYPRYKSEVEDRLMDMFFLNDQSFWAAPLTAVATTSQPWGWFLTDLFLSLFLGNGRSCSSSCGYLCSSVLPHVVVILSAKPSCRIWPEALKTQPRAALAPRTKHFISFLDFQAVLRRVSPTVHVQHLWYE